MMDNRARVRHKAAGCVRAPGPHFYSRVGEASNMALERPACSHSLAAAAHRRRSAEEAQAQPAKGV